MPFIYFMPWLGLNQTITLGNITFWSYHREANQRIADSTVREYLNKFFESFVDHQGTPVTTIVVCSHADGELRIFSEAEFTDLRQAIDALVFISIIRPTRTAVISHNGTCGPPSSNIFELRYQSFAPNSTDMSFKAGDVSHFGLKIGEFFFSKPWATGGSLGNLNHGQELIQAFDRLHSILPNDLQRRIFRSLEWFKLAHVQDEMDAPFPESALLRKVVMMTTAFESLLDFPERGIGKADYFAEYVQSHFAVTESLIGSRVVRKQSTQLCLAACWAYDFYKLRNKVVHGDGISLEELRFRPNDWVTQLMIADLVYGECLRRIFFENRLIGDDIYSLASQYGSSAKNLESLLDFNDYHKVLGWIQNEESNEG